MIQTSIAIRTEKTENRYTDLTIRPESKLYVIECAVSNCVHPAGRVDPDIGLIIQSPHGRKTHTLIYTFGMLRKLIALEGKVPVKTCT